MANLIRHISVILLSGLMANSMAQAPVQRSEQKSDHIEMRTRDVQQEVLNEKVEEKTKNVQTIQVSEQVYDRNNSNWYRNQADAWRQSLGFGKNDANAWFNYYKSEKYSGASQTVLDQIVAGMNANVPNTFETHYVNYLNGNRDLSKGGELMKAYLLDPNRKEIYKELAVYFTLKGDQDNLSATLKKWSTMDDIPQSLLDYSYNLLNTIPQNGVLVTDGEYDTYPLWILQDKKHRPDVKVLNIELLRNEAYKERICKEFGLNCFGYSSDKKTFIRNLVNNNPTMEIYFSYTVNSSLLGPIDDNLFNEGIAFRYSADVNYNYEKNLADNWEIVYRTDYLQKPITGNAQFSSQRMQQLHLNYVSSGLELYDKYQAEGDKIKASKLYDLLLKLAKSAGKEELVKSYLSK